MRTFLVAAAAATLVVILAFSQAAKAPQPKPSGLNTGRGTAENQAEANWHHPASEPAGVENVALHEDPTTGMLDVFARYPAGYTIPQHYHSSNERIVVIEGQLQAEINGVKKTLDPGGFAFLPAREVQRLACTSKTRCVLYMSWDGSFDSHKVQ